jgi:hypothetical protein
LYKIVIGLKTIFVFKYKIVDWLILIHPQHILLTTPGSGIKNSLFLYCEIYLKEFTMLETLIVLVLLIVGIVAKLLAKAFTALSNPIDYGKVEKDYKKIEKLLENI